MVGFSEDTLLLDVLLISNGQDLSLYLDYLFTVEVCKLLKNTYNLVFVLPVS